MAEGSCETEADKGKEDDDDDDEEEEDGDESGTTEKDMTLPPEVDVAN